MAPLTRSLLRTVIFSSLLSLSLADTCQYIRAAGGDGCWSLAQKCGISQDDLKSYNPVTDFCNNIKADQVICCSAGDLPDFSPKPSSNGTCFTYTVNHDDTCDSIATANKMDKAKIPGYNNETWGWAGCSSMQLGQRICLSEGTPPFPAPMEDAKCGPQVGHFLPCCLYLLCSRTLEANRSVILGSWYRSTDRYGTEQLDELESVPTQCLL